MHAHAGMIRYTRKSFQNVILVRVCDFYAGRQEMGCTVDLKIWWQVSLRGVPTLRRTKTILGCRLLSRIALLPHRASAHDVVGLRRERRD